MKLSCIQTTVFFGEPQKNYVVIEQKIRAAAAAGADVIVLPEMWNTGYALSDLAMLADVGGEQTKRFLSQLAQQLKVNIIGGSVAVKEEKGFYNRTYVMNRSGELVSQYDKVHLFGLMAEDEYMQAGKTDHVFTIDGITQSSLICYDLRFSEWVRQQALQDAHIIYVPAQWPEPRLHHWRTLLQARAIENQCFIVGVNVAGSNPANTFAGHSLIINPWGEIIAEADESDSILQAEIQLEAVAQARGRIPIFADRRPDLYNITD
ncbi:carbon-nitrogen family hydrolase [Brochothrix campestris]|uniref:Nitrilase n=1 Tax=Brochothrix campestris FSL F6-1037 TaxID=1265861 RepID=W7CUM4_9LIST|nr:carbon-nitrogen family hydrolase [Brochothrix campestris]EUJ40637.1 nitrilase [Brochothrix campestris FSL F6-1037]